jgi:CheY-like chemotaxis protein
MGTAKKHSVLIVDDNPNDVVIAKMVLTRIDHDMKVEAAFGGEDALERLRSGDVLPSLILLDLKMPGMSGFDFLRKLRADERIKHIPVIVVSSSSLQADEKGSYSAGADGFLHKAFDMDKFSNDMKSFVERWLAS